MSNPASAVHQLLFQALLEIRDRGHDSRDKVVFHLADLFHHVVLKMEAAARGEGTYDDALRALSDVAAERGLQRWLSSAVAGLTRPQP